MRTTSSSFAPSPIKPVLVFINWALVEFTTLQASIISSSVSLEVSTITFTGSLEISHILLISSATKEYFFILNQPSFMTMSNSSAPSEVASLASSTFISVELAPRGKPITHATSTLLPNRHFFARLTQQGFTHTLWKRCSFASWQSLSISSCVAVGLKFVWSMYSFNFICKPPKIFMGASHINLFITFVRCNEITS